jgi:hypothetical protein
VNCTDLVVIVGRELSRSSDASYARNKVRASRRRRRVAGHDEAQRHRQAPRRAAARLCALYPPQASLREQRTRESGAKATTFLGLFFSLKCHFIRRVTGRIKAGRFERG